MKAFGTITIEALRDALATSEISDLALADGKVEISLQVEPDQADDWAWCSEEEPQHDAYALDDFLSAAIGGDHCIAAGLASRLFTESNLDLVERRLARGRG